MTKWSEQAVEAAAAAFREKLKEAGSSFVVGPTEEACFGAALAAASAVQFPVVETVTVSVEEEPAPVVVGSEPTPVTELAPKKPSRSKKKIF